MKNILSTLTGELVRAERRWIVLEGLPAKLSRALVAEMGSARWIFPDEVGEADFKILFPQEEVTRAVLDGTHLNDKSRVAEVAKKLLLVTPETKVMILTAAGTGAIELPDFYGEGKYVVWDSLDPLGSHRSDDSALLQHSHRLIPKYRMEDLILGQRSKLKLQEAIDYIRSKEFCETELGFRERHSRGHGVTLLLNGMSGTGKTMAAEVVASTLEMPLYQIDLSSVMSKWVGETEKNLKSIFRAAQGVQGILLFDEGDAIFGQRTEVKASQDRYSNLEVNYLLQEIERFEGIAILSTNHQKNLDSAFLRRFTYCITFGFPGQSERTKIWKANVPSKLALGQTVDFEGLSEFPLTGGNIKNCIRDAAAIAVSRGRHYVEQVDLLWAVKRELQKDGRDLDREIVGETYWREVATEWEFRHFK